MSGSESERVSAKSSRSVNISPDTAAHGSSTPVAAATRSSPVASGRSTAPSAKKTVR